MTEEQIALLKLADAADAILYRIEEAMRLRINPEHDPVVDEICDGINDVRDMRRKIHKWTRLIENWTPIK